MNRKNGIVQQRFIRTVDRPARIIRMFEEKLFVIVSPTTQTKSAQGQTALEGGGFELRLVRCNTQRSGIDPRARLGSERVGAITRTMAGMFHRYDPST